MRADVIIVGSGVAALSAALAAAPRQVLVLTPARLGLDGASHWAQGGIAAALGEGDSPAQHAEDTLAAGAGYGDPARVAELTRAGPELITWLQQLGARFDLDAHGRISLGREAAHGHARIVHARGDATGAEVMRALVHAVRVASHIEVREGWRACGLLQSDSSVCGVLSADREGRRFALPATAVILATGGIGQLFRYTTNPLHADGSGLAMAIAVGAALRDLEFVQFHPTALAVRGLDPAPLPLLTEALRGAGAILIDSNGRRFMASTAGAELAARDVVARAVYRQLRQGPVYLDSRAAVGADFPQRFPAVFALAQAHGLDPRSEPLPVAPAVHYHMGGIAVDAAGRSSVDGLFAVGEVACSGVHGANRLASNSLLEGMAYGRAVGGYLAQIPRPIMPARLHVPVHQAAAPQDAAAALRLRHLLWDHAGIERTAAGLQIGMQRAQTIAEQATQGTQLAARAAVTMAILAAALARPNSLGAHCRSDADEAAAADALQRAGCSG
jgi:L-aspartate oxidase